MTRNYELVYYVAQNVGIIGILAYSKIPVKLFWFIFCYTPNFMAESLEFHVEKQLQVHLNSVYARACDCVCVCDCISL